MHTVLALDMLQPKLDQCRDERNVKSGVVPTNWMPKRSDVGQIPRDMRRLPHGWACGW